MRHIRRLLNHIIFHRGCPEWRSRSRSSSRIHSAETSTASVRVCGDRASVSNWRKWSWVNNSAPKDSWLVASRICSRAHFQSRPLIDTPNRGAILWSNKSWTDPSRGDNFDLDAIEPCQLIAAVPSPCGSPSACERGP